MAMAIPFLHERGFETVDFLKLQIPALIMGKDVAGAGGADIDGKEVFHFR